MAKPFKEFLVSNAFNHIAKEPVGRFAVLAACLLALLASPSRANAGEEPRLDLVASFSLDGGKTWSADFPVLERPD